MDNGSDMVIFSMEGEIIKDLGKYKKFLLGRTDSKITEHYCLFEGKAAFEKLPNHVIICQLTVQKDPEGNWKYSGVETTPVVDYVHPLFSKQHINNGDKLWRFINLQKFEDLINSRKLHFARIDQFDDNLEGISPLTCIDSILNDGQMNSDKQQENLRLYHERMNNNRKVSYACCWHINDSLNHNLWEEYGNKSIHSIGIQTNVKRLNNALLKSGFPVLSEPIRYFDEPYFNQYAYWFPTMFKRSTFQHEQEFRTIIFVDGCHLKGLKIQIKPEELITKIYVHPLASKEFFKKIRLFVREKGLKIPVTKAKYK